MAKQKINLCTICARKGSKGVKNKNLKKINGLTLLEITIKQAIDTKLFNKIIVSTDSKKIESISKRYKIDLVIRRSNILANDSASKIDVIKDALIKSENHFGFKFDNIIDLDLTTPLRRVFHIKEAFNIFLKKNYNNLLSVCVSKKNPYFNILEIKNNKTQLVKANSQYTSRQKAPKTYEANSAIYIWKRLFLLKTNKVIYPKTGLYVMPRSSSIDIDDNLDLLIVKKIFNQY